MSLLRKFARNMGLIVMCRVKGTVILVIWKQVVLMILYTTGLACVHNFLYQFNFQIGMVSFMGIATALLSIFRTNTAYDRYWDGRKLWSTIVLQIRVLTRCIWILGTGKELTEQDKTDKLSTINHILAFAFATRNYLRGLNTYEEKDLRGLINYRPEYSTLGTNGQSLLHRQDTRGSFKRKSAKKSNAKSTNKVSSAENLKESNQPPSPFTITSPESQDCDINIPIEISWHIATHIKNLKDKQLADDQTATIMTTALNIMTDCLGGFERIVSTPVPLPYAVHLHHVTWLYFLALPFSMLGDLNWFSIPAVALTAFSLLGVHGIGEEIEYPFGYDDNDLPLDDFCEVLRQEILTITGQPIPEPESWLLSEQNCPFLPESALPASVLLQMKEVELREILTKRYTPSDDSSSGPQKRHTSLTTVG